MKLFNKLSSAFSFPVSLKLRGTSAKNIEKGNSKTKWFGSGNFEDLSGMLARLSGENGVLSNL
jgi:hypothetical protein